MPRPLGPALLALLVAAGSAWARPPNPGPKDLWRYAPGDKVESLPSAGGKFRVHFTRAGQHAVPLEDSNKNGAPDHVEQVAALYEQVLAFYQTKLGFRPPLSDGKQAGDNGGDGRFDVYLLDFAGKADGTFVREACSGATCSGFLVQENDFAGYAYPTVEIGNRTLASHELFHAVQAAYDVDEGSIAGEGTAVWATEKFDPTLDDFEHLATGYLDRADRSLDLPIQGPVDAFSYGASLFFQFLDERFGGPVIRELWEDAVPGARGIPDPTWYSALPSLLERRRTSFAAELVNFATWNLMTGRRADPKRSYARGSGLAMLKMPSAAAPYRDETLRVYYASTQYRSIDPRERSQITAAIRPTTSLASLRLVLFPLRGDKVGEPLLLPVDGSGDLSLPTAGVDRVIVMLVNTAREGESARGTLCVGAPAEVAPCRPSPPDMAGPADDQGEAMAPAPGGGCTVGGRGASPFAFAALLLLVPLLGRRRRQGVTARRASRVKTSPMKPARWSTSKGAASAPGWRRSK